MECGVSLRQQRPTWRCTSLRHTVYSPGEVVPGSQDPGSSRLHRFSWSEVWIVTCACTQASWWLQQQPLHFKPVSGVRADSRSSCPSLELVKAVLWIPSTHTPWNNGLLSLRQVQTFSRTPSLLAVVHYPPSGCVHAANPSPLPGIWPPKTEPQLPAAAILAGEQTSLSGWWELVGTDPLCGNLSA